MRDALGVGPGDFVRLEPTARGTYELVPAELVPREDLWQLHPELQARRAESRADIEAGRARQLGPPAEATRALEALQARVAGAAAPKPRRPRGK